MQWEIIIALVIAIPIILFPAAFIWYLNLGGLIKAVQDRRVRSVKKEITQEIK